MTGTHYLIADDPLGPWTIAPGPFLDGASPARRYAGKIVETSDGLALMGFLHDGPDGFIGAVADPIPVRVNDDGAFQPIS